MKRFLVLAPVVLTVLTLQAGEIKLQDGTTVRLAGKEEGARILGAEDAFTTSLSPFDRSARMETDREVSKEQFLGFVALQALPFTDAESEKLKAIFASIRKKLSALNLKLKFPPTITVIKTTGKEEGGAAYCRGTGIVLPRNIVNQRTRTLEDVIIHELFHILCTTNPKLRPELYAVVGFSPCKEVRLPKELLPRKITNPDAFKNDSCVEVGFEGRKVHVIPILFSSSEKYDVGRGGRFFNYLVFKLMAVERRDKQWVPTFVDGKPLLLDVSKAPDYIKKVGRNTGYIIHPEEVLADNFRLMLNRTTNVPTSKIPEKMKTLLSKAMPP